MSHTLIRLLRKYRYYGISIFELLFGFREWQRILSIFTGRRASRTELVSLRRSGLAFDVRGAMDIWSLKETFIDRFYERFGTAIEDGWRVLDIGAGIGDFTIYAAYGKPHTQVYAFEPFPDSYRLLQENLKLNRISNVEAFCEAVSGANGELVLDLTSGEPLQFRSEKSRAIPAGTVAGQGSRRTMAVMGNSLEQVFRRLSMERCDLLKLDCEGAEYEILFQAPAEILDRIDRIVMEYHDGVTEYSHLDLVTFLGEKGYTLQVSPNAVHPDLGYLRAIRDHT